MIIASIYWLNALILNMKGRLFVLILHFCRCMNHTKLVNDCTSPGINRVRSGRVLSDVCVCDLSDRRRWVLYGTALYGALYASVRFSSHINCHSDPVGEHSMGNCPVFYLYYQESILSLLYEYVLSFSPPSPSQFEWDTSVSRAVMQMTVVNVHLM